jgi:hypothetical protein
VASCARNFSLGLAISSPKSIGVRVVSRIPTWTRVKFDLTVDPSIPIPGFILKKALKGAMDDNTNGLRKRVLSVKKGGS